MSRCHLVASWALAFVGASVVAGAAPASPEGRDPRDSRDAVAAIRAAVPACDVQRAHCFGLQLHVAADQGALVADPAWVAAELAMANQQFAPIDVGFEVAGVDTLPASAVHIETRAARNALAAGGLPGAVVHVFVIGKLEDVDDPGAPIHGVAWHLPDGDRKYIIIAGDARDRTLAHELGHVFGLPHSSYAVSIMNKTKRDQPPLDERRFADEELPLLRRGLARLLGDKLLADVHPAD